MNIDVYSSRKKNLQHGLHISHGNYSSAISFHTKLSTCDFSRFVQTSKRANNDFQTNTGFIAVGKLLEVRHF